MNHSVEPALKAYLQGVAGAFANDNAFWARISGTNRITKGGDNAEDVLPKMFAWARGRILRP